MKKRIHINQHKIRANKKHNQNQPVVTVKTYNKNVYGHTVKINGPSTVTYNPCNPLSCGARVWVETESDVEVTDQESGQVFNI